MDLAREFLSAAMAMGVSLVTGVPCSRLSGLIDGAGAGPLRYVAATEEGEAAAIGAGVWLGGGLALVLTQSSGLGNMINPLVSLHAVFGIPVILVVSVRGDPAGPPDEPQHRLMGEITAPLLDLMNIPSEDFPTTASGISGALERARTAVVEQRQSYAFLVRSGHEMGSRVRPRAVPPSPTIEPSLGARSQGPATLSRTDAVAAVRRAVRGGDLVIATTGYIGRELFAQGDRDAQFYMVGSMGCAAGIALGLSLTRPEHRIIVLDGDGAALMRMGTLATIGAYSPSNLVHMILDNGRYASTGGQVTASSTADLARIAAACGYREVLRVAGAAQLETAVNRAERGPCLIHVEIADQTSTSLPRPDCAPRHVATRLRRLCSDALSRPRFDAS